MIISYQVNWNTHVGAKKAPDIRIRVKTEFREVFLPYNNFLPLVPSTPKGIVLNNGIATPNLWGLRVYEIWWDDAQYHEADHYLAVLGHFCMFRGI